MSVRSGLFAVAMLAGVVHAAGDAPGARDAHGVADAYARPGLALAWGVLRGRREDDALVVVRVETSAAEYAFVSAEAVDPFSTARKALQPPTRAQDGVELRLPRAQFAEFPRTEFSFSADATGRAPALTVYYLGVPDTTPEFATPAALAAYLADRIARERASAGTAR